MPVMFVPVSHRMARKLAEHFTVLLMYHLICLESSVMVATGVWRLLAAWHISVQFSSVPWPIASSGRLSRKPPPVFTAGGHPEQFWHGQDKEVDLAPHPVVGLVLKVGDAEKFPQALGLKILDPFFPSVSKLRSMSHSHREGWRWRETCNTWNVWAHRIQ